jgi:glycosyltransferase involved in cell wall biosynthesis
VLAGPVGPHHTPERLAKALADPDAVRKPDVRYWCDEVAPYVDGYRVKWIGSVRGAEKETLVARARASVFPLRWEEPGRTAVVESLALGTPVVGYRRGCLPELIDHGRTALLVEPDEDGLVAALRAVAMIRPAECRREAARPFTPARMAAQYLRLYDPAGGGPAGRAPGSPACPGTGTRPSAPRSPGPCRHRELSVI